MAALPAIPGKFTDDGRLDRSKESFQGVLFDGFRQKVGEPISFFRSDFRKTRITNCSFRKNNFSRCDFITSNIINTEFDRCDFQTSSIINSRLYGCVFHDNENFNPDMYRTHLECCRFQNQSVARASWRDSTFEKCLFDNFTIERSTLENVNFIQCRLSGSDISQIAAYDLSFDLCDISGVVIDPDYLGTYTFSSTDLLTATFSYRANRLDFTATESSDLIALGAHFKSQQRWSEAFNVGALIKQFHPAALAGSSIEEEWNKALVRSTQLEIAGDAAQNVSRLFQLAKHYLSVRVIPPSACLRILGFAEQVATMPMDGLVYEAIGTGRLTLTNALNVVPNIEGALALDPDARTLVRFQVQFDSDDENFIRSQFGDFLRHLCAPANVPYRITRVGFGSILVEAVSYFLVAMLLFRAARSASYTLAEIRVNTEARRRTTEILNVSSDVDEIVRAVQTFRALQPDDQTASEIITDEVLEVAKTISSVVKEGRLTFSELMSVTKEVRIFIDDFRKGAKGGTQSPGAFGQVDPEADRGEGREAEMGERNRG